MSIRIGVVGANVTAREIVDILISIESARVVAICDRDLSLAETLARRCKARAFRDARAMLKPLSKRELLRRKNQNIETEELTKTLDAICVCTQERNRSEAISLAFQSGCEVFVASPLALSIDAAQKIMQVAQDQRARLWTGHDARFSPSCEHARKLLTARGTQTFSVNGSWKIDNSNLQNKAARDAQFLASSTRCVDALRFLNGEIKSVFARASNGNITLAIDFASGVVGALILGERCETALHWTTQNSLLTWRNDEIIARQNNATQHIEYSNGAQAAQRNELRAWLQSVESGRRTLAKAKPEDALKNLRVALAIGQSIKTHKMVRLMTS